MALALAVPATSAAPKTKLMSQGSAGRASTHSSGPDTDASGNLVAFSTDSALTLNDFNGIPDIYLRNVSRKTTTILSRARNGVDSNGASEQPAVTASGRYVVFVSAATNLTAARGAGRQVYRHDLVTGRTVLVSKGALGVADGDSTKPAVSASGRYVVFASSASNLSGKHIFGQRQIYLRDMVKKKTFLISQAGGQGGNGFSWAPVVSADGRFVAFYGTATNLSPKDERGNRQVFLRDRKYNKTFLISKNSAGKAGDGDSSYPAMSDDGRIITFESDARNLIRWGSDTNNATDVFKYDRGRKATSRVSVDWKGRQLNGRSEAADISANGKVIAFVSNDWNAVSGGGNGHDHVYRRGRAASSIKLVDRNNHGQQANAGAHSLSISASGKYIAYVSGATNLGWDYNGKYDAFRTGPF